MAALRRRRDMSIGLLNLQGCAGCALQLRAAGAILVGGGNTTNMLAWVAAYDITTVPWGALNTGNFTSPSQTTPPTQSGGSIAGALSGSQNQLHALNTSQPSSPGPCTIGDDGDPVVYRAQALLPFPTAYYIMAWGVPMDSALSATCGAPAFFAAQGCIYPQQPDINYPMIVDLPIPDDTLDSSILVQNYNLGLITPGAGYSNGNGSLFAVEQDLNWGAAGHVCGFGDTTPVCSPIGMNGLGPNWNNTAICFNTATPSAVDPFTGIVEPP
jgi:hypothetical protein